MPNVNGRYELIETLGTGATSRVDKARDTLIGRTVALKTFLSGFGSRQLQEQFLREAQIIGQLAHPSIVSLYDVGTDGNGRPYFVMEFVEGETLEKALEAGPLSPEKAAAWGGDLAIALAHAHQAQTLHGDVKPANILITKEGRPKLGDFGIARCATHASSSGSVNGTPAFLSPEQIRGQVQDARSDLFSLGIVLYQMTAGVHPFDGSSVSAVCGQILSSTPEPPSHHNPALSPAFDGIVMRCLAKDPVDRFATADDLAASLYPLARSQKPQTSPTAQEAAAANSSPTDVSKSATRLPRRSTSQAKRTTIQNVTSWWKRPVRGKDVWLAGATAGILALSLVPLSRALHGGTNLNPALKLQPALAAPISPVARETTSSSAAPESTATPVLSDQISSRQPDSSREAPPALASAVTRAKTRQPAKPRSIQHKNSHASVHGVVPAPPTKTASEEGKSATPSASAALPSSLQTSLNIAVVSEVEDATLVVYSDDDLLLKTQLEAAHRGDTLRFHCPITTGDHLLRVMVYRGTKEVAAQKENNSELRAAGGNTLEVHVSRRSRMLVKRQTSLEIVWPSRAVASTIHNTTQSASTN
jgi:serine/threonine-protein kinase